MVHVYHGTSVRTYETVLRDAMQALVRVQAHMLARTVVEIRAADENGSSKSGKQITYLARYHGRATPRALVRYY